ncbi:MAG: hypothetical protein LBG63_06250 [Candidatus Methanoplasma sp.]|jgi:phenylacetate-coenzyme A ligase PaaK-like adenylate-forming protein|nr:hypothetical protein [Candidatus Methanoplasma sp.]
MILANRFNYPKDFQERCMALLDMAFEHVPVYKEWKRFDPGPHITADERFDALPILTKNEMRAHFPLGLMPDWKDLNEGLRNEEIQYTYTSGTTSEKVVNIWDQGWWDRSEAASWELNRHMAILDHPQRQAKLASSLNVGINCEEDLPMSHRILGNTLYLNEKTSILQWQPHHLKRMVDELNAYRPIILEANSSLLARLAYRVLDNREEVFSPQAIVFTFEFPSAVHLAAIRRVFSSAFVSSYGTTETGFVMEQCECGLMHQNMKFCRIDFQPLKEEYGGPELGRIFVTTFDNPWNCIIRFDVGDLIRLHPDGVCDCGRCEGMIADAIEGRVSNVTFTTAGGLVTTKALDDRIATVSGMRDYRLEQLDRTHYLLEAALSPGTDRKEAQYGLRAVLENVYGGNGDFDIRIVADILPGPAGKYRRTQANFEFDEKELFI